MRLLISAAIALVTIGYLVNQYRQLVRDENAVELEAARDADTLSWLRQLRTPDSEFDEWCAQAIALTREPWDADLKLWEHELGGAS